jgi:hypothetical protein
MVRNSRIQYSIEVNAEPVSDFRYEPRPLNDYERTKVGCEFVFGDPSIQQEPYVAGSTVAIAIALAIDDALSVESIIQVKWLRRSKAIGVDSHRLLYAVKSRSRIVHSSAAFAG